MQGLSLRGTPYDMGYEHGERLREQIRTLCEERIRLLCAAFSGSKDAARDQVRQIGRRMWDLHEAYAAELADELVGIADGADVDPVDLLLMNGYADFADVMQGRAFGGCTAFWTGQEMAANGMAYLGQTEVTTLPHTVALRLWPEDDAPAVLMLSVHGCLGLAGVNEAGIAVITNKLSSNDTREGVNFVFLVRKALRQFTLESAVRSLVTAPRASGHNYIVADCLGRAVNVETSAQQVSVTLLERGYYVHTDHYLSPTLRTLERLQPPQALLSSEARRERMRALLDKHRGEIEPRVLRTLLADHEGETDAICRHAETIHDMAACAAAILSPQERQMWVVQGNPRKSSMLLLRF